MGSFSVTLHDSQDDGDTCQVLITEGPNRVRVTDDYLTRHQGCPFDTALRLDGFTPGSDAYYSPRTHGCVLYEVRCERRCEDETMYIGLLARHDQNHPSRNELREVKWKPYGKSRPVQPAVAARDAAPSHHRLLFNVFRGVSAMTKSDPARREIGRLGNKYLSSYLATMCHDITGLYQAEHIDRPNSSNPPSTPQGLVEKIAREHEQGMKYWRGRVGHRR